MNHPAVRTAPPAAQPLAVTLGGVPLLPPPALPAASEKMHRGERYIGIDDVDAMPPFFTTAVGDNECWLFAGSNGPLCAGRREPDQALFPYVNVDRIIDQPRSAGFLTSILIGEATGWRLWEPWSDQPALRPRRRALHRHELGAGLLFSEADQASGLRLEADICTTQRFGLVRRVTLVNEGTIAVRVRLLDGWHRLITPGVSADTWASYSYLAQAYMRHERQPHGMIALHTLNAAISDQAEPREVLRCAASWWVGPLPQVLLLSTRQCAAFRRGETLHDEDEVRGETGALLACCELEIAAGASATWIVGADTGLDQAAAGALISLLGSADAAAEIEESIALDRAGLRARLAAHDGLSCTGDRREDDAHRCATLFNLMRGGVLPSDLQVRRDDLLAWLARRNRTLAGRRAAEIRTWPEQVPLPRLGELAAELGDAQLERLAGSYLPLSFSRRHGDPSRPWNRFSIKLFDDTGRPLESWQGNWRDIFQNWEALALSFPSALPAMIATFLDASTADGYNPYRVTSDGLDWEVPEDGPWSHFGYWGDHQIVYLGRLLELAEAHHPGWIRARLGRRAHASADVPYRIKPYAELLADPRHGVTFDRAAQAQSEARCKTLGSDGRLLPDTDGQPLLLTLAEKLFVPVLVKLGNLVPGAGIWLNTQRPEWNDANNALVGWGCSAVTAFQLRRHLALLGTVLVDADDPTFSAAGRELLDGVMAALPHCCDDACTDPMLRRAAMDRLGAAGERHRQRVYGRDLGGQVQVAAAHLRSFVATALTALDATLERCWRPDGLLDSYTVLEPRADGGIAVLRLDPMLEGQVAAIASGWLGTDRIAALWQAMRSSALWDDERGTFLLYPDRTVAPFLERNRVPLAKAQTIGAVRRMLEVQDARIVVADGAWVRFQAGLVNARELSRRIDQLADDPVIGAALVNDRAALLALYEDCFGHRSYLGRSTTMFAFEGLGSVYWHMVSKLHLALLEARTGAPDGQAVLDQAIAVVRAGLGSAKTPADFGAFPFDPYSHTPAGRSAQQPGMTGQVKEEILARRCRMGIAMRDGQLCFAPKCLRPTDRLAHQGQLLWVDRDGRECRLEVPAGGLAITICQVPVLFRPGHRGVTLFHRDGRSETVAGLSLGIEASQAVIHRSGAILRIEVGLDDCP